MTATDGRPIDDRYDPAFQRGYSPESETRAATASHRAPTEKVGPESTDLIRTVHHEIPRGGADDRFSARSGRNPYIVSLGVMSVASVATGVGGSIWGNFISWSPFAASVSPPIGTQILQSLTFQFSGPLVTIGVGIAVALIFFNLVVKPVAADASSEDTRGATSGTSFE